MKVLKKLIDKTAEIVADEGWDFAPWQNTVRSGVLARQGLGV